MVIDVWSWTVTKGKGTEALNWLNMLAQYHGSKGINARALSPVNGSLAKAYFEAEFESLAALEEYWQSYFQSDVWQDDHRKGVDLLDGDSALRHQYRVVE